VDASFGGARNVEFDEGEDCVLDGFFVFGGEGAALPDGVAEFVSGKGYEKGIPRFRSREADEDKVRKVRKREYSSEDSKGVTVSS
jgi:hypothetical protein